MVMVKILSGHKMKKSYSIDPSRLKFQSFLMSHVKGTLDEVLESVFLNDCMFCTLGEPRH